MRIVQTIIIFLWFSFVIKAQQTQMLQEGQGSNSVFLDPSITHGKLPNGFQYFIKPIEGFQNQLKIKFIVKAGFNQEGTDQFTLSHFMEHIALKAGKNVSTTVLYGTDLSREVGISRGSVNAYTARDFTEYTINIPNTDKALNFAFQLIQDMMSNLEFKDRYIESERSPFFDESEFRGGTNSIQHQTFLLESKILGCAAESPENYYQYIMQFPKQKLIRFYKDWYRPQLMGLVMVGDIPEPMLLEKRIENWFSTDPLPESTVNKDCNSSYLQSPDRFIKQERAPLYKDRYSTNLHYKLYFTPTGYPSIHKGGELMINLKKELLLMILKERFSLLKEVQGWPFYVFVEFSEFPEALKLNIQVPHPYSKQALMGCISTLQQLKEHGILPEEFEKAKANQLQSLKDLSLESQSYWIDAIRKYFLKDEPLPANKKELLLAYLQKLTKNDLEEFFQENYETLPQDIGLIAPEGESLALTEKTIRGWMGEAAQKKVKNFTLPELPGQLLDSAKVNQLEENNYRELVSKIPGVHQYQLQNGLKLILKPFQPAKGFFHDQEVILFKGITSKGTRCFQEEDYFSAINAPAIIARSGVGDFKEWEVKKILNSQEGAINAYPYINYSESGIQGKASIEKLETVLQLVYLYFTGVKKDEAAFQLWEKESIEKYAQFINWDDFRAYIENYLGHHNYLPKGTKRMDGVSQTDLKRAYIIYQNIFGEAKDFTFHFSGDFDPQKVLELCNKYLGNLPNRNFPENLNCGSISLKKYAKTEDGRKRIWRSKENMKNTLVCWVYRTKISSSGNNWKEGLKLKLLANLMDVILMKKLRIKSEQGGPYAIRVSYQYDHINHYHVTNIQYSCSPKDKKRMAKELRKIIEEVKKAPVDRATFQTVLQEFMPRKTETNSLMLEKLVEHTRKPQKWYSQKEIREYILSLNPDSLHQTAIHHLKEYPLEFQLISG